MGGSATGPYVDDFTTVDFMAACGSGQCFINTVIQTMGRHFGPDKHKPTREQQVMLGAHVRMDTVLVDGMILFEMAKSPLAKKTCTPAEAAKLRGMASWAAGNTFGRVGRLGLRALKARQYQKEATSNLDEQLLAPVGDARGGSEGRRTAAPRVDHLPAWSGPPGLLHGVGPWVHHSTLPTKDTDPRG